MDIAFDIETIPNTGMIGNLPEPEVKTGNLKDPAKIAEKIAEAKADAVAKMALNPLYGRVCAWVAAEDTESVGMGCLTEETDADETRVIEELFQLLSGKRIISYNGNGFDLPFVYRRAVLLGIDVRAYGLPTLTEMTKRYNRWNIDLMQVWCGFGGFEKLDNVARVLTGDGKIEIDFKEFPELIKSEEGREKLLAYCAQDVFLSLQIWNRVSGILI